MVRYMEPELPSTHFSRSQLRDLGLPKPPKKVAAPQHWLHTGSLDQQQYIHITKCNLLGPLDEAGEIPLGLDVLADAKVLGPLLK